MSLQGRRHSDDTIITTIVINDRDGSLQSKELPELLTRPFGPFLGGHLAEDAQERFGSGESRDDPTVLEVDPYFQQNLQKKYF